jgi:cell division septum initiation protein DivIVA
MTKAEEMQRYDDFVRKLPQDSYLRPWLAEIRDEVEADLRCDIFPSHTPRETQARCRILHQDTASFIRKQLDRKRADAHRIIAEAKAEAKRITEQAERDAERIRNEIGGDIIRLRRALDAVA